MRIADVKNENIQISHFDSLDSSDSVKQSKKKKKKTTPTRIVLPLLQKRYMANFLSFLKKRSGVVETKD